MEGVQFKACTAPTTGLMAATATLVITAIAMRALKHFRSPMEMGTALAFSAAVGFIASSLQKSSEEKRDEAAVRLPKMQDNVLCPQWTSEQSESFKALYSAGDGVFLREAALSGTIDMVRWSLEKAFTEDRTHYDKAFEGPWPKLKDVGLDPREPIKSLSDRSDEPRFERVHKLLAEVRKVDAYPELYTLPVGLRDEDRQLLTNIQDRLQRKMDPLAARFPNIERTELARICRVLGFKSDLAAELEEAKALPTPIVEWNDRTRALLRLQAGTEPLPLERLQEVATEGEKDFLELLINSRERHGQALTQQQLESLKGKPKPPQDDHDEADHAKVRELLLAAVMDEDFAQIDNGLNAPDAHTQYLIAVVAFERGLSADAPNPPADLSLENQQFVAAVRDIFRGRKEARQPDLNPTQLSHLPLEQTITDADPERLCDLLCTALREGWGKQIPKSLVGHADRLWEDALDDDAMINLNLCRGLVSAARDIAQDPGGNRNFGNPAQGEAGKTQAERGALVLSIEHEEKLTEACK